ncbi:MAG: hypothetical protein JW995_03495 [Melioribacteraceae bacterium]|nr:hypothetical protein [Melioribacteraceae bacterium]
MNLKKIIILFFIPFAITFAQIGYVDVNERVYSFLSRMNTLNLLENYSEFVQPKSAREIASQLITLANKKNLLNPVDKKILDELLTDYEYVMRDSVSFYSSLLTEMDYNHFYTSSPKYLFFSYDSGGFSFYSNLIINNQYIFNSNPTNHKNRTVNIIKYGGIVGGTLYNNLGYRIKATNGTFFGNRNLAELTGSLKYNFKFRYDQIESGGVDYFDETEGYFYGDWEHFRFKIGRDRLNIGYGEIKSIIGNNAPNFDFVQLEMNYGMFNFSFFHGKLLGRQTEYFHPVQGQIKTITDKYFGYHRMELNFGRHLKLGAGEIIIYSKRSIDFSYLNPFNFYKSVEHANQDRDNSMLFFDFRNNSFKGLKLYATILLDDINFEKIGTNFYGNQMMLDVGGKIIPGYRIIPVEIEMQYLRIDPYLYTHRINENNFTNNGFIISDNFEPNSENYRLGITSDIHHRINFGLNFIYTVHGSNILYSDGSIKTNVGGDINIGHRVGDQDKVQFLDGQREYSRVYNLFVNSEFIKNYFLRFDLKYISDSPAYGADSEELFSTFTINIKI